MRQETNRYDDSEKWDTALGAFCGRCGEWPAIYLVSGHDKQGLVDDPACAECAMEARSLGLIVQGF